MATDWDGKSRGTVLGFKVFVFFIKNFGIHAAYMLMHLPIPYFFIFLRKNVRGLFYYFNTRLQYSRWKSNISIYKTYYVFGQGLVDKFAIALGKKERYTFIFDGEEHIKSIYKQNKGGILISAHVGNFELARYFFNNSFAAAKISIVITDQDHQHLKDYFDKFLKTDHIQFIVVKDDFSHIFEMNAAFAQNRLICISGDRYLDNVKYMEADLLGKKAKFPIGPFHLASRLDIPVLFVYVMREPNKTYHLYAREVSVEKRNAQYLLEKYTKSLETIIKKYPLQWFNFYDFWDDIDHESKTK